MDYTMGHNPYMDEFEQRSWLRGEEIHIEEYVLKPKRDFGKHGFYDAGVRSYITMGWVVTKGGLNAVPGAGWYKTREEAVVGLNLLIASKGDAAVFHALSSAMSGMVKAVVHKEKAAAEYREKEGLF